MKPSGIKVFAPASLSNLAVGFDILGLALENPCDEVIAWKEPGTSVRMAGVTGQSAALPEDPERNAVCIAARAVWKALAPNGHGIALELHKRIPVGSGLGGSAASAVAGVMAVNELLGRPLSRLELLPFAMEAEKEVSGGMYADNVCACLLGGIVLVRDSPTSDIQRLPTPKGLFISVVLPDLRLIASQTRGILKPDVPVETVVAQTANLAGFIHGLWQSDFPLIRRSLRDAWIEPQRASSIPGFYEVQETARQFDTLGCSISGSGPAIFALFENSLLAEEAGIAMQKTLANHNLESRLFLSRVNEEGARRL